MAVPFPATSRQGKTASFAATSTTPSQGVTATPSGARVATANSIQSSPHYQTTRRHSLYGTEDRIVIDPGSYIWKVGFSGEGRPRDVFHVDELWSLKRATDMAEREEEDRVLEARLQERLRSVFHDSLLTDPKSRKIIILEHPLLPVYIKDMLARILFNNLQVPSISFASMHLLALLSVGRITGLVLDCGQLESTVLPIFSSRPLFPQLRTTPLAGARFTAHLRNLLLLFGTYVPPPATLSAAANIPIAARSSRVPQEILSDSVIEHIKTRCCFVGPPMDTSADGRLMSPSGGADDLMELDLPLSSDAPSESDFSRVGSADLEDSSQVESSGFSMVSRSQIPPDRSNRGESHLQAMANLYKRQSTATDLHLKVVPPVSQQTGTGRGTLIVPGWIRERCAEVLFDGGDVDESSVAETILDALLKVPVDLRKTLASSILVIGGTAMLPGFIPRLHSELLRAIASSPSNTVRPPLRPGRPQPPIYDRYAPLRPLVPHLAILNNPAPPAQPTGAKGSENAGKAPAFTPACMAWVGGSLAGAMKIGGTEVPREKWDEADHDAKQQAPPQTDATKLVTSVIPDWTRARLPEGAPPARVRPPLEVGQSGAAVVSVGA